MIEITKLGKNQDNVSWIGIRKDEMNKTLQHEI